MNQLDTSSYYGEAWKVSTKTYQISDALIAQAESQEQGLYRMFGVNSFNEFKKLFSEMFVNNNNDRMAFLSMANVNITPKIKEYFNLTNFTPGETADLVINFSQTTAATQGYPNVGRVLIDALNKIKATKKSDWLEVTIDCETETINIPSMVWTRENTMILYKFLLGRLNTNTNFNNIDKVTSTLSGYIEKNPDQFIEENPDISGSNFQYIIKDYINRYNNSKGGGKGKTSNDKNFIMQSNTKILSEIYENNPTLYNNLMLDLKATIKSFINYNNTSPYFQQAFEKVWNDNLGNNFNHFFAKGNNLENGLKGAFGELQTAMLPHYIASKTSNPYLKSMLMDITAESVLGKSDVDFGVVDALGKLQSRIGIQVKNVSALSKIDVKAHPSEVDENGFADCIINSYFNKDNPHPSEAQVKNYLKTKIPEMFHMGTDFMDVNNLSSVNFYMIQGQYLVPISSILRNFDQQTKIDISPPSSYQGSDQLFREEIDGKPRFVEYYRYPKGKNRGKMIYQSDRGDKIWHAIDNETIYTYLSSIKTSAVTNYNIFD